MIDFIKYFHNKNKNNNENIIFQKKIYFQRKDINPQIQN